MTFSNQLKTVILLGLLTGLLLWVGQLVGGMQGLTIAIIFALLINVGSFWFSDRIVLAMYRAKEVSEKEEPELHRIIREVSGLAGIPMPKVYKVPSETPNAFATGRGPSHSAVAVTSGIMELLTKDELKGVIAHEISHIKNRDVLIATIAATIAGVISYVAMMARWAAIFGGFGGRDSDSNGLELLVLAILTPLLAVLIQLAISRSREYNADATAARTIHNSAGLAQALLKLEAQSKRKPMGFGSKSGASLFIVNPFSRHGLTNLFSTHPPIEERVRRLKSM